MTDAPEETFDGTEIAVVGLSGRWPGAPSAGDLWRNLVAGHESITFFTEEELLAAGVTRAQLDNPRYVRASVRLDGVDQFDATFFGIPPRDADLLDPQQRLFLECAWEALESAACDPERFPGAIGVYAGSGPSTYLPPQARNDRRILDPSEVSEATIGNSYGYVATRTAYKLNLRGPVLFTDTACSTSLVAVHLACQSLLTQECDLALAGGVSIKRPMVRGYEYREGMISSPDGHCRPFDAKAGGTVIGQGLAVVALRRLSDALEDGDPIRAVIRGSAVNNDGRDKVSFTAPSVTGQAEVIAQALAASGVEPGSVSLIEAHGTATKLGDPIEIAALDKAYGDGGGGGDRRCAIVSVKSNFGHLETAAGVTSLIKTVLALEHRQIPPSLNFETPNPEIDFDSTPFFVNTELREWETDRLPRRAGVSSFGFGGTNAHVIVEEAPALPERPAASAPQLLVLSAKNEKALAEATDRLAAHLEAHPGLELDDVAWTLQTGRQAFFHRRAVACADLPEAVARLRSRDPRHVRDGRVRVEDPPCAFMFTGQGSQYPGMALGLHEADGVFRRELDLCSEALRPILGTDLRDLILAGDEDSAAELRQTRLAQPALFAVEYALARMWEGLGVTPAAMIGHSIGEYVAATLAGVFALEDALALVAERGRLMQELPPGSMLVVHLSAEDVAPYLADGLTLAASNAPSLCVVSGPTEDVRAFAGELSVRNVESQPLHTSHAFHSGMMEPAVEPFRRRVEGLRLHAPRIPFVSNVTGNWISPEEATDPGYWARHLREPVRFAEGIARILEDPRCVLLEVGPGRTLATLARQHPACTEERPVVGTLRGPREPQADLPVLLDAVGQLWAAGRSVRWEALPAERDRRRVELPTYAFQRQRHWVELDRSAPQPFLAAAPAGKRADVGEWLYRPLWKQGAPLRHPRHPRQGPWLVFADGCGLATALVGVLVRTGGEVVVVEPGRSFERVSEKAYRIDPRRREDYAALLAELAAGDVVPQEIVHLWGVSGPREEPLSPDEAEAAQERGFASVLLLARALVAREEPAPARLTAVTDGMQQVTGEDLRCPEKASVLGPCRVIPQEHPELSCASVDVELAGAADLVSLAERLALELFSPAHPEVALRGQERWLREYEPVAIPAPEEPFLRERGVYLVTGGLGGIGFVAARLLAERARARLLLVGRTPLPPRQEWDARIAAADPVSEKLQRVRELEALGAEVDVAAADVADEPAMREAVDGAVRRWGALDGVIAAAGIVDASAFGRVAELDPEACLRQFRPKLRGTLVLHEVLRDHHPAFCLLTSSLSSVLGGLAYAGYAAANQLLDALAAWHNQEQETRWLAVDWDAWRFQEGEAGGSALARLALTASEGAQVFERLLDAPPLARVVVSTAELSTRLSQWVTPDRTGSAQRDSAAAAPGTTAARRPRPELSEAYAPPTNELEEQLAEIWAEVFGFEKLGIHDDFFELGGHSLLATRLASRLRDYELELSLTSVFDAPTIAAQAELLLAKLLEEDEEAVEAAASPEPAHQHARSDG